jgi:hypothetical protein
MAPTLGQHLLELISNQLEIMYLIVMHGNNTYTLAEITNALCKVLGESAGYMLVDSLVEQLDLDQKKLI